MDVDQHRFYAIAASPTSPPAVDCHRPRKRGRVQCWPGGALRRYRQGASAGRSRWFHHGSDGDRLTASSYPAMQRRRPPLVVFVHGGPTVGLLPGARPTHPVPAPSAASAVADLNYRGSTGYGREYRQALHLALGEIDVGCLRSG